MSVYTEKELNATCIDEAISLLNKAKYLTESESAYHPEMVPIKENTRLGKKMIRLEDFVEYAFSNGNSDANTALQEVANASKISTKDIAFSVDEVSILEDINMEETVRQLISAGASIYASPISESNIAYILAEACYKAMRNSNDKDYSMAIFEAYVNDDFNSYLSDSNVENILNTNKRFSPAGAEMAIEESTNNPIRWVAEQIASLRSVQKNYLNESDKFDSLFTNGIIYLDTVRKENI